MAGQSVGLVTAMQPVAEIIDEIVEQAVAALAARAPWIAMGGRPPISRPRPMAQRRAAPAAGPPARLMARGPAPLPEIVRLVAVRAGGRSVLGLRHAARRNAGAGATRACAPRPSAAPGCAWARASSAWWPPPAQVMNLADAQNHPAFAYRPETGEEPFASMLAVPVRRAGRTLGVLAVQNRAAARYTERRGGSAGDGGDAAGRDAGRRRRRRKRRGRAVCGTRAAPVRRLGAGGRASCSAPWCCTARMRRGGCWPTTRRAELARLDRGAGDACAAASTT